MFSDISNRTPAFGFKVVPLPCGSGLNPRINSSYE